MKRRFLGFAILFIGSAAAAGRLPNLELKDISADALPYMKRYAVPITNGAAFSSYLERIQHEHEIKVEEGLPDMMGDYFLTTQKIETGYYFTYKIGSPGREMPQVIRDRAGRCRQKYQRCAPASPCARYAVGTAFPIRRPSARLR